MKMSRSYKSSPAPAFDAVEDVKFYLGDKFDEFFALLRTAADHEEFDVYCDFMGIRGFPVKALYELIHGQGTWN